MIAKAAAVRVLRLAVFHGCVTQDPSSMENQISAPPHSEVDTDASYGVTATTSLPERRLRVLKDGHTFGLFDPHEEILPGPGCPDGIFHDDTRFLNELLLLINGQAHACGKPLSITYWGVPPFRPSAPRARAS